MRPTDDDWRHVLFGEGKKGGHVAGADIPGKSQFPPTWHLHEIKQAMELTQLQPDAHLVDDQRTMYQKRIEGHLVEVQMYQVPGDETVYFRTVFPKVR